MKKFLLVAALALSAWPCLWGQDVTLPEPRKTGGMPLMDALMKRQSTRSYADKALDGQTLSDLLWAAYGFNRSDKRVVPSAQNKQAIDLYVALRNGIYLYDAKANKLVLRATGNHLKETGTQDFVATAPVNLVFVLNTDKAAGHNMGYVDCGFIAQNVYLFCASAGLATVVRGSINREAMQSVLKLTDRQEVVLAQTIGYAK